MTRPQDKIEQRLAALEAVAHALVDGLCKANDVEAHLRAIYERLKYVEEFCRRHDSFFPHTETCLSRQGMGCNCGRSD